MEVVEGTGGKTPRGPTSSSPLPHLSDEEREAIYRRQQQMSSQEEQYQISNEFSDPEHPQPDRWSTPKAPEGLLIGAQGSPGSGAVDLSPILTNADHQGIGQSVYTVCIYPLFAGPGPVWLAGTDAQKITSMSQMQITRGRDPTRATAPAASYADQQYYATVNLGQPIASVSGGMDQRGSGTRSESCVPFNNRPGYLAASGRSRARSAQPRLGGAPNRVSRVSWYLLVQYAFVADNDRKRGDRECSHKRGNN